MNRFYLFFFFIFIPPFAYSEDPLLSPFLKYCQGEIELGDQELDAISKNGKFAIQAEHLKNNFIPKRAEKIKVKVLDKFTSAIPTEDKDRLNYALAILMEKAPNLKKAESALHFTAVHKNEEAFRLFLKSIQLYLERKDSSAYNTLEESLNILGYTDPAALDWLISLAPSLQNSERSVVKIKKLIDSLSANDPYKYYLMANFKGWTGELNKFELVQLYKKAYGACPEFEPFAFSYSKSLATAGDDLAAFKILKPVIRRNETPGIGICLLAAKLNLTVGIRDGADYWMKRALSWGLPYTELYAAEIKAVDSVLRKNIRTSTYIFILGAFFPIILLILLFRKFRNKN